jgi:hypothetical protein
LSESSRCGGEAEEGRKQNFAPKFHDITPWLRLEVRSE